MSRRVRHITIAGEERVALGHPWIYRSDIARSDAPRRRSVRVLGPRGRPSGQALYSDRSEIALRLLTRGDEAPRISSSWRSRLDAGDRVSRVARRSMRSAYRLVHGEADLLPSLIVDRYGDYLVVQALSQGMDRLLPDITQLLVEHPAAGAGSLPATIPASGCSKGSSSGSTCCTARCPDRSGARRARQLSRRSV